jgi:4-hydroxy-4-methyl-2-oxoglutarate aldolase
MTDTPTSLTPDIVARFKRVQSGVVCDALGRLGIGGWMDDIHPFALNAKLAGRARTLRYAPRRGSEGPTVNIYEVIRSLNPGDVLVIETSRSDSWIFGENMAHTAMYQGLAGIVTDSRARDGAELAALGMPCFARGLATRPPAGIEIVAADVPITCGGAQVRPHDLVVGDADGVVVVPGAMIDAVLVQVEDLDELERQQEAAIRDRVPLPELLAVLAKKKIRKGHS